MIGFENRKKLIVQPVPPKAKTPLNLSSPELKKKNKKKEIRRWAIAYERLKTPHDVSF